MSPPLYLYKYRSLRDGPGRDGTRTALLEHAIYFPIYAQFNDPFDCNLDVSPFADKSTCAARLREINPAMSEAELAELVEREMSPERVAAIDSSARAGRARTLEGVGILSLSAKPDNLLMWSYYADGHRGVCLQFRLTGGKLFGCDLTQVSYQPEAPSFTVYDRIDEDWARRSLSTKALAWQHEQEWRIIWRIPGMNDFPPEDLTGVILGAQISSKDRAQVLDWIRASSSAPLCYQARRKVASFAIEILPVDAAAGGSRPTTG
jgi:hypothetical protein